MMPPTERHWSHIMTALRNLLNPQHDRPTDDDIESVYESQKRAKEARDRAEREARAYHASRRPSWESIANLPEGGVRHRESAR